MGTKNNPIGIAGVLFTPVQQRVLGLLFGQPDRKYQSAELIRLAGAGTGATHRLLQRLAQSGLVTTRLEGRQRYYQANAASPVFDELTGLIRKTSGLTAPLRDALAPLEDRIELAFVYGSIARGEDHADSDIDLMVVSDDLDYPTLIEALEPAERALGRPVNPRVIAPREWRRRRAQPGSFAARVAERPQLYIVGDEP